MLSLFPTKHFFLLDFESFFLAGTFFIYFVEWKRLRATSRTVSTNRMIVFLIKFTRSVWKRKNKLDAFNIYTSVHKLTHSIQCLTTFSVLYSSIFLSMICFPLPLRIHIFHSFERTKWISPNCSCSCFCQKFSVWNETNGLILTDLLSGSWI